MIATTTVVLLVTLFSKAFNHPSSLNEEQHSSINTIVAAKLMQEPLIPIKIWSSDFHISPVADIKQLVSQLGATVIDKSLSGHCHLTGKCARDLRVINQQNGIRLSPCSNQLRREFYDSYRNDPELLSADAFLCTHADSMCELFMPFNRPLIVIASTRYEIGRHDAATWQRWNNNLYRISLKPFNTIGANNVYDLQYMQYFTQLSSSRLQLLPSLCAYVTAKYKPSRREVLLAPARGVHQTIQRNLQTSLVSFNNANTQQKGSNLTIEIVPIRTLYPGHYQYDDLTTHPAVVILPYQVSVMSVFELYRMGIPMFVPCVELLTSWHIQYHMLSERTWMSVFGMPQHRSALPRHLNSSCPISSQYDPNDEYDPDALKAWLALSDFYQWPGIAQFKSFEDLFAQLQQALYPPQTTLVAMSKMMKEYSTQVEDKLTQDWQMILQKIREHKQQRIMEGEQALPVDINEALIKNYGIRLRDGDCEAQDES